MKLVAVNYSDENFRKSRKLNTKTAKWFGGMDEVFEFSPEDIDRDFHEANKSILCQQRGGGYWLWKPYFINKVLAEMADGDYLFYCDSGAFYINSIDHLIKEMDLNNNDIMLFESPLIEREWSNRFLINALDMACDKHLNSNQIVGGYILLRKSKESVDFMREYLQLCTVEDYVTDCKNQDDEEAIDHRHDQSILSLLAKKKNLRAYKDPSDYGVFPFRYFSEKRLFRVNSYSSHYPPIVLSNRKANPYVYYLKFLARRCLKSIFGAANG